MNKPNSYLNQAEIRQKRRDENRCIACGGKKEEDRDKDSYCLKCYKRIFRVPNEDA